MLFSDYQQLNKPQRVEIPGHSFILQSAELEDLPEHSRPPYLGLGLVHVLRLTFVPVPHDLLHVS